MKNRDPSGTVLDRPSTVSDCVLPSHPWGAVCHSSRDAGLTQTPHVSPALVGSARSAGEHCGPNIVLYIVRFIAWRIAPASTSCAVTSIAYCSKYPPPSGYVVVAVQ